MMLHGRLRVHVLRSADRRWVVEYAGMWLDCDCRTQAEAVRAARECVGMHVSAGGEVQIIVHKANGDIQRDVTLPRSSDPRRSRG